MPKKIYREEYQRNPGVDFIAVYKAAEMLIPKLFAEKPYSHDEQCIFQWFCRNSVENFIYREILNNSTPIEIEFKRDGEIENSLRDEVLMRLAVTYVLHEQHNRRLQRCDKDLFSLSKKDDYLLARIFSVARRSPDHPERQKFFSTTKDAITFDEVFNAAARKISLTYISPGAVVLTWNAPDFDREDPQSFEVTLSLVTVRDKEMTTYADFIRYLLTEERNGIGNFSSTALWRNAMNARFRKDSPIEDFPANTIHLLLFCLALGMNTAVYSRLIALRKLQFGDMEESIKNPPLGENELKALERYLDNADERLRCARNEAGINNKNDIVRRVLVNVSIDLIKAGLLPVLILTDEEIELAGLDDELVKKAYDCDKNGKRTFKRNNQ